MEFKVYTSNNQLGGIQIMFKNGVTHAVVNDDFEGICKIIKWLSYLPDAVSIPLAATSLLFFAYTTSSHSFLTRALFRYQHSLIDDHLDLTQTLDQLTLLSNPINHMISGSSLIAATPWMFVEFATPTLSMKL